MKRRIYFFLLFNAFIALNCFAQEALIAHIQKIGVEDGLSSYDVWSVIQASDGVMWFGTAYGLNRYDGANIRSYTKESHGLYHDRIQQICEDDQGKIWVWGGDFGGEQYMCVFDPITEKFLSVEAYTQQIPPFKVNYAEMYMPLQQKIIFRTEVKDTTYYYKWANQAFSPVLQLPATFNYSPFEIGKDSIMGLHWVFGSAELYENKITYYFDGKLHHEETCEDPTSFVYGLHTDGESVWVPCMDESETEDGNWQFSFLINGQQTPKINLQTDWKERFVYYKGKAYTISNGFENLQCCYRRITTRNTG